MKRSGLPDGQYLYGDVFLIVRESKAAYRIETMQGDSTAGGFTVRVVEDGLRSWAEAQERALALSSKPLERRLRFRLVAGGKE